MNAVLTCLDVRLGSININFLAELVLEIVYIVKIMHVIPFVFFNHLTWLHE